MLVKVYSIRVNTSKYTVKTRSCCVPAQNVYHISLLYHVCKKNNYTHVSKAATKRKHKSMLCQQCMKSFFCFALFYFYYKMWWEKPHQKQNWDWKPLELYKGIMVDCSAIKHSVVADLWKDTIIYSHKQLEMYLMY